MQFAIPCVSMREMVHVHMHVTQAHPQAHPHAHIRTCTPTQTPTHLKHCTHIHTHLHTHTRVCLRIHTRYGSHLPFLQVPEAPDQSAIISEGMASRGRQTQHRRAPDQELHTAQDVCSTTCVQLHADTPNRTALQFHSTSTATSTCTPIPG